MLRSYWFVLIGLAAACSGASPDGSGGSGGDGGTSSGGSGSSSGGSSSGSGGGGSSSGFTIPDAGHHDSGHGSSGGSGSGSGSTSGGGSGGGSGSGSGSTSGGGSGGGSGSTSGGGSGGGSGSGSGGGSGSGSGSSSGAFVDHVPGGMPQVLDFGGPVMATPVFQSISFPGYDETTQMDTLVSSIGASSYWKGAVGEYGIGTPTVQAPVHLTEAAPTTIDDTAIQTWLQQKITAGGGIMPASANALYVISYPTTTTVTLQTLTSCQQFGGYHNSTTVGGINVAYAVVPECTFGGMTTLQTTTGSASHELIEAVTDPYPFANPPTYSQPDDAHLFMEVILGGGEVGDMCAQWGSSFFVPPGLPYTVQRTWSNAAATAGRDPCQPELPGEVYFSAMPLMTDSVNISYQGQSYPTNGVSIAQGASKTISVQLYSEAPVGPWTVSAVNWPNPAANLSFTWDKTTGQNGDTLQLTITVNAVDATYAGESFVIESSNGSSASYWLGFVGQ